MYLFAANVNKIQRYIFSSSRLADVVGASYNLEQFSKVAAVELLKEVLKDGYKDENVIIADGGSFRIIFDDEQKALEYGKLLCALCRSMVGAPISIVAPIKIQEDKDGFKTAIEKALTDLGNAKQADLGMLGTCQIPQAAYCACCGTEMAVSFTSDDGYICRLCLDKRHNRDEQKAVLVDEFLQRVYYAGISAEQLQHSLPTPESITGEYGIGNYVAYLVADGNRMGMLFGTKTEPAAMKVLSNELGNAIKDALAVVAAKIIQEHTRKYKPGKKLKLPVLPLITGGDDCFAVVPARYAFWAADIFAREFEKRMPPDKKIQPRMSIGLVICKANYPYYTAHRLGEHLLKNAKLLANDVLVSKYEQNVSTMNFALAGEGEASKPQDNHYHSGAPYVVAYDEEVIGGINDVFNIRKMLEGRAILEKSELSAVKCQGLRELYRNAAMMQKDEKNAWKEKWTREAEVLLKRIGQLNKSQAEALKRVIGTSEAGNSWWLMLHDTIGNKHYGHYLPDILEMWDFLEYNAKNDDEVK